MKQKLIITLYALTTNAAAFAGTAFVNVNIITMTDESIVRGQTVIIEGRVIEAMGPVESVPVPGDALVVDGTDRYLLPGLAEMHAHVPEAESPDLERVLALFAANGVTTIRGMLGHASHLQLRRQLLDGEIFGPRLITSGPSLNGNSVSGPLDAEQKVRSQHAAGYDFIKIHPGLTASEYARIATTAKELGMPFAGHVPVAVGVEGALDAGMATIDHLDGYLAALMPSDSDPSGGYGGFFDVLLAGQLIEGRIAAIAGRTAESVTWNVPTEALFEHRVADIPITDLQNRPEMRYVPKATAEQWLRTRERQQNERGFSPAIATRAVAIRRKLILALHDAGAGLLLGSDAPQVFNVPGFSAHHELAFLVAAGLTPFEALQTGTTAVARFLGSNTGVVAVGRDADLLLLDADPLEDIANTRRIHGVMLRGIWYPARDLDRRLTVYRQHDD